MRIDHNRLQKSHGLSRGCPFGEEHRAGGGPPHELTHGAHVLVEQGTRHEISVVGVERHRGRLLSQQFARRSLGNIVEGVDFAAAHGVDGFLGRGIVLHDVRVLKGIEIRSQRASGHAVVQIDQTHRHVGRQTLPHQRGE